MTCIHVYAYSTGYACVPCNTGLRVILLSGGDAFKTFEDLACSAGLLQ